MKARRTGEDRNIGRKDRGIRLSPKHGVNPTLLKCFWCGGDNGIALLGRLKGDAEAPRETCLGLAPCDKCRVRFSKGVHVIEVTDDGSQFNGNRSFAITDTSGKTHWPTGRWAVLRPEAVKGGRPCDKMLVNSATMDKILREGGEGKHTGKGKEQ